MLHDTGAAKDGGYMQQGHTVGITAGCIKPFHLILYKGYIARGNSEQIVGISQEWFSSRPQISIKHRFLARRQ